MKKTLFLIVAAWLMLSLNSCNPAKRSGLTPKERQKVSEILKTYGEYSEKSASYGIWTAYRGSFDDGEYVNGIHTISLTADELLDTFEVFRGNPAPGYYCKYADAHQSGQVHGKPYQLVDDGYGNMQVKWDSKTEWYLYYDDGGLMYDEDEFRLAYEQVKRFHDPVDSLLNDMYGGKYVFSEHLAPYCDKDSGKYGFVNEYLDVVIEAQFDSVGAFKNKTAIVYRDGNPDFVTHSGHLLKSDIEGCWSYYLQDSEIPVMHVIDFQKMMISTKIKEFDDIWKSEAPIKKITPESIVCGSDELPLCIEEGMFRLSGASATHYSTVTEMESANGL